MTKTTNNNTQTETVELKKAVLVLPRLIEFTFYGVTLVTLLQLSTWWFEQTPIAILERRLVTPIVEPGGELRIENIVAVASSCDVDVVRELIDANGIIYNFAATDWPDVIQTTDDFVEFTSVIPLPDTLTVGEALYRVELTWYCNPLQVMLPTTFRLNDLRLTIVPRKHEGEK